MTDAWGYPDEESETTRPPDLRPVAVPLDEDPTMILDVDRQDYPSASGEQPVAADGFDVEPSVAAEDTTLPAGAPLPDGGTPAVVREIAEADQLFLDRLEQVAHDAVEVHALEDRPVEDVFAELAMDAGLINAQFIPTGVQAQHIARLELVRQELDFAVHELHTHDPEAVIAHETPENIALAVRTQEIPAQSVDPVILDEDMQRSPEGMAR